MFITRCLCALLFVVSVSSTLPVAADTIVSSPNNIGNFSFFSDGISSNAGPQRITVGPDGNMWFADHGANSIGRITMAGEITEFSDGITLGAGLRGIAAGSDGNIWFTEYQLDRIGRITPDGVVTEFSDGISSGAYPWDIAAGPDGNLWFTEAEGSQIGRITPDGVVTEFSTGVTFNSSPYDIVLGNDGNLWFTEYAIAGIGKISPLGSVTEFRGALPINEEIFDIAAGPDGNFWFTYMNNGGGIGQITQDGAIILLNAGSGGFFPAYGITVDSGNNVWFTGQIGDNALNAEISLLSLSGGGADYEPAPPNPVTPKFVTEGPDGNIWFTQQPNYGGTHSIGRLNVRIFANGFDAPASTSKVKRGFLTR